MSDIKAAREAVAAWDAAIAAHPNHDADTEYWTAANACIALVRAMDGEAVAWEFQHNETGRMTQLSNDGVNNPENFIANNPRYGYVGPLYRHPSPALPDAVREAMDKFDYILPVRGTELADNWQTIRDYLEQGK